MNIIKKFKRKYSEMDNTKRIIYGLFLVSFMVPLISDIIYKTKSNAEEHMFGAYLSVLSSASFAMFNVIILLYVLMYFICKKVIPCIPEYIERDYDKKKGVKDE